MDGEQQSSKLHHRDPRLLATGRTLNGAREGFSFRLRIKSVPGGSFRRTVQGISPSMTAASLR
jgi:hypothetical protein